MKDYLSLIFILVLSIASADWPQAPGANGDFSTSGNYPLKWSVAENRSIAWKLTLPETGQSTPVISNGKVFFTTLLEVHRDSEVASGIVAWCCDEETGKVLWQREIPGRYPLKMSGPFSDSSSPPAVCDGKRVVFINGSGTIACFDLDGNVLWKRVIFTASRNIPFLSEGKLVFTRQNYPPDAVGHFTHEHKNAPSEQWTQLQALDMATGQDRWITTCGVNMGCAILPQKLSDGRDVALVGRGGGHSPPEKPEGVSLVDLKDGSTIWTLPLEGFMATQTNLFRGDRIPIFHKALHLMVNAFTGKVESQVSFIKTIPTRKRSGDGWISTRETLEEKKGRMITQGSNLLVGKYHYFRSYTSPYLGRVNVDTGTVEYLELPLQLSRKKGEQEELLWYVPPQSKQDKELRLQSFALNDMKNSRGFVVSGDARDRGNGWGHIASPTPSVAGDFLYVPVMSGTVYVIRWNVDQLTEDSLVAVNDLGPAGKSWTRASLAFANGKIFAHTIKELICLGE